MNKVCLLFRKHLLVDNYVPLRTRDSRFASDGKPFDRMSVEEGPRRDDKKEGKGGATEADLEREGDVLEDEANEERDALFNYIGGQQTT